MTGAAQRRGGRPREFDPIPVIRAGRDLLEAEDLAAFTIRALSKASKTTVTSIYRNIGDREAVLSAVLDAYAAEIQLPELPKDPVEQIVTIFTHAYDFLRQQLWAVRVLTQSRQFTAPAIWYVEYFLRAADALGIDETESVEACRQVWAYTIGSLQTLASTRSPDERSAFAAEKLKTIAGEREYPRAMRMLDTSNGLTRDGFIMGLRTWCSGWEARQSQREEAQSE